MPRLHVRVVRTLNAAPPAAARSTPALGSALAFGATAALGARSAALLPLLLALAAPACGGEEASAPPPKSAPAARAPRGERVASAGNGRAMGDSALEPAAAEAAQAEDWPQAESLYQELARRQPRNAAAKRGLGVALLRQQKSDEAVASLQESLQLADEVETRLSLAEAFAALDRYPSALPHLRKAAAAKPQVPLPTARLAAALIKVDKPEAAAEVLRDSRKTCPKCARDEEWNQAADEVARACATRARKQAASGDGPGAHKFVDLAVGVRPDLPEAHLALGQVARAEGDDQKAATAYRKAVDGLPDANSETGATARLELAALLLKGGDGGGAVKLAEQVVAARGDDGVALDTLGRACDSTQNKECARRAYSKLATLPAGDKVAVDHAKLRMKQLKGGRGRRGRR